MLAELVKPVGDGAEGPEKESEGGAAVVSQVNGLNGVSDQTFPALFHSLFIYLFFPWRLVCLSKCRR